MKSVRFVLMMVLLLSLVISCRSSAQSKATDQSSQAVQGIASSQHNSAKVIYVVVALCDNQYQGIVPVPALIENSDDPARNLYWGAAYGVKTFFKRADNWALIGDIQNPKDK